MAPSGSPSITDGEYRNKCLSVNIEAISEELPSKRLGRDPAPFATVGDFNINPLDNKSAGSLKRREEPEPVRYCGGPGPDPVPGQFETGAALYLIPTPPNEHSGVTPPTPPNEHSGVTPPTPPNEHSGVRVKPGLTRSSKRLYSRVLLGLRLPGRYYFITWTSSPRSPPIEKSWNTLRVWLHRHRPGASWCYCLTAEGYGVIHMVLRLGPGEERLDAREVRAHWVGLHKANQIRLEHVHESTKDNLAGYLADQRSKRKLGTEMGWQDQIVRWRWSKGWLPRGFTKAYGRLWWDLRDAPPGLREKVVCDWLGACNLNDRKVLAPPKLGAGNEILYPAVPEILPEDPEMVRFDKLLKETVKNLDFYPVSEPILEKDDLVPEGSLTLLGWRKKYLTRNLQTRIWADLRDGAA